MMLFLTNLSQLFQQLKVSQLQLLQSNKNLLWLSNLNQLQ